MKGNLIDVTSGNFKKEILDSKTPVLVDFWASWCMPCKMMTPVVDELSEAYKNKIKFAKVNVDDNAELATNLQILSIPALIIFKDGREVKRLIGVNSKDALKNELENILKK